MFMLVLSCFWETVLFSWSWRWTSQCFSTAQVPLYFYTSSLLTLTDMSKERWFSLTILNSSVLVFCQPLEAQLCTALHFNEDMLDLVPVHGPTRDTLWVRPLYHKKSQTWKNPKHFSALFFHHSQTAAQFLLLQGRNADFQTSGNHVNQ